MLFDAVGEIAGYQDAAGDAGLGKALQQPLKNRPAAHFEQALGRTVGEGTKAQAAPRHEDNGLPPHFKLEAV
jgi:hypothetical protein